MKSWRARTNTIRFKLIANLLYLLVLLMLFLFYVNTNIVKAARLQIADLNQTILSLYLEQIDGQLSNAQKWLVEIAENQNELLLIGAPSDENEYALAQARIAFVANSAIANLDDFDGFFVYSPYRKEFITAAGGRPNYALNNKFFTYLKDLFGSGQYPDTTLSGDWSVVKIDRQHLLLQIMKTNEVYIGAWIQASSLLKPLAYKGLNSNCLFSFITDQNDPIDSGDFFIKNNIVLDDFEKPYIITGSDNRYLAVVQASKAGHFNMVSLTPLNSILGNIPYLRLAIIFFIVATLLFLPLYQFQLRRIVIKPIQQITSVMKVVRDGHMSARIAPTKSAEEFLIMNSTFNNMLDEIDRLKNAVYEENIQRQKAEIKHLQGQVNPHFFLNSLNIIYTLARTGEMEILGEMCRCMIEHFRYMFRSNTPFVSLSFELEHVRNYIRIQQLRFPEKITLEIDCPDFLENFIIPPLMIHTFVENSIRHALKPDKTMIISIDVGLANQENVQIVIKDTGNGFDSSVLKKLKAGSPIIDSRGNHIGIDNVQRRLGLLYKDNCSLTFDNIPLGGAMVKIIIPLDQSNLNEEGLF